MASAEELSPLHNPINGLDVDGNSRIQAHDALLVINVLLETHPPQQRPRRWLRLFRPRITGTRTTTFGFQPAMLLVISALTTVPEPSSIVLAGAGLAALAGYAWRAALSASSELSQV